MKHHFNILLSFCLVFSQMFSAFAFAEINTKDVGCTVKPSPVEARYKINDLPQYFYKISPDGKWLAYIGTEGNRLISLKPFDEKNLSVIVPGHIDPVFTPDGNLLMVPMKKNQFGDAQVAEGEDDDYAMSFYDPSQFENLAQGKAKEKDVISREKFKNTLFRDKALPGVYQTAGTTGKSGTVSNYKVITDHNGVTVREYAYDSSKKTVKPTSEPYAPCKALETESFDTPVMSKDGQFLSVRNKTSNSSQVYHLKGPGECSLALDLGVVAGKVSLSFDNKRAAFHIDEFADPQGYFSGVKKTMTKNVYVMNINIVDGPDGSKKIIPESWARASSNTTMGEGSYYPEFLKDGSIIYVSDKSNYFEFEKINPEKLTYSPYFNTESKIATEGTACETCNEKEISPIMGLATLWANVCAATEKVRPKDALLIALSLDEKSCLELVNNKFDKSISEIYQSKWGSQKVTSTRELSKDDLLPLCSKDHSKIDSEEFGKWEERKTAKNMSEVLQRKCASCHAEPMKIKTPEVVRSYFNEKGDIVQQDTQEVERTIPSLKMENLSTDLAYKILTATTQADATRRMPKAGQLSEDENSMLYSYLNEVARKDPDNWEKAAPMSIPKYSDEATEKSIKESLAGITDPKERKVKEPNTRQFLKCYLQQNGCDEYIATYLGDIKVKLNAQGFTNEQFESNKPELVRQIKCAVKYDVTKKDCEGLAN